MYLIWTYHNYHTFRQSFKKCKLVNLFFIYIYVQSKILKILPHLENTNSLMYKSFHTIQVKKIVIDVYHCILNLGHSRCLDIGCQISSLHGASTLALYDISLYFWNTKSLLTFSYWGFTYLYTFEIALVTLSIIVFVLESPNLEGIKYLM